MLMGFSLDIFNDLLLFCFDLNFQQFVFVRLIGIRCDCIECQSFCCCCSGSFEGCVLVFVAACWLSLIVARGVLSSCGAQASHCHGCSHCRAQAPGNGLCSCGAQAQLPHHRWSLPRPGIKPVSPALAGRFLTTGLPGKSMKVKILASSNCCSQLWTLLLPGGHLPVSGDIVGCHNWGKRVHLCCQTSIRV